MISIHLYRQIMILSKSQLWLKYIEFKNCISAWSLANDHSCLWYCYSCPWKVDPWPRIFCVYDLEPGLQTQTQKNLVVFPNSKKINFLNSNKIVWFHQNRKGSFKIKNSQKKCYRWSVIISCELRLLFAWLCRSDLEQPLPLIAS